MTDYITPAERISRMKPRGNGFHDALGWIALVGLVVYTLVTL